MACGARPLGGGAVGLLLTLDDNEEFRSMLARFIAALESGIGGTGPLGWSRSSDSMFPAAHHDRRRSREFRELHSASMRRGLLAAAERIQHRLTPGPELYLDPQGVADWFTVCGHMQSLFVKKRWSRNPLQGTFSSGGAVWLQGVQDAVADAALELSASAAVLDEPEQPWS